MASITIAGLPIPNYHEVGVTHELRIFSDRSWVASDDSVVPGRGADSTYYDSYILNVVGTDANVPSVVLYSTQDGLNTDRARYTAQVYVDGAPRDIFLPNVLGAFKLASSPTSTTWGAIETYNSIRHLRQNAGFPDTDQVNNLINIAIGTLNDAAVGVKGRTSINPAPASAAMPIAEGANSRRITEVYNVKATAIGAVGDGVANDRTVLNTLVNTTMQAGGAGGDVYFPPGTYLIGSSMTFPANVRLVFDPRAMLKVTTGQTVTIVGVIDAAPYQIFTNATAGLGTISFLENKTLREVYPEWWGGGIGVDATTNTAVFVAVNAALITNVTGDIVLGPGNYDTNGAGFRLGTPAFTGIGIRGTNGLVGSRITYAGTADAITVYYGRYNRLQNFNLVKSGSKGSSRGIVLTGPATGANTFFVEISGVLVSGFDVGIDNGDAELQHDADLTTLTHVDLESNNIGLRMDGFNSTRIDMYAVAFESNTTAGIWVANTSGPTINLFGGVFGRNGVGIRGTTGNYYIEGVRDEYPDDPDYVFYFDGAGQNAKILELVNCSWSGTLTTPLVRPIVYVAGPGIFTLDTCSFAYGTQHIIPIGQGLADGAGDGRLISISVKNCLVNENVPILQYNSTTQTVYNGLRYKFENNEKLNDAGVSTGHVVDEDGIIDWPNKVSFTRLGSGFAGASVTADQITANQNNYSPRNAGIGLDLAAAPMYLRLSSDASRNITGLTFVAVPQIDGQTVTTWNVGSFNIVLKHQDAASTAANRFLVTMGADLTLAPNEKALLEYDGTTARWRVSRENWGTGITVIADAGAANNFLTAISAAGVISKAQPTFSNLATGTAPAFTLGDTVSGGGQQVNNVIVGTVTPLAGFFTTLSGTSLSLTQREAFPPTAPAQITANQNNYNPGGNSVYLRLTSDISRNITGLTFTTAQTDGEVHTIVNIGAADIVLKHQDAASTATNRFLNSTAADITLTPKQAADVIFDTTNGYWLVYKRS